MATTTPNFGWSVPTSTDLVKDGATAIETLGDAIDASLVDLKGGTSGQVLKKNSNTDMDFVWGTDSAGMTNPMTTTGDIIYSSSGSTPARLGIGTSGQVLNVTAGVPAWTTIATGGSWSQAATGSLTGSSVTISSLSGKQYYVACIGWSHTASSEYIMLRLNGDSGTNYRRTDSDSAVSEIYPAGSVTVSGASTRSIGFHVDMTDTSMAGKPITSVTPQGNVSGGWYMSASAITSITILTSGGTFDAGTYYVWSFA